MPQGMVSEPLLFLTRQVNPDIKIISECKIISSTQVDLRAIFLDHSSLGSITICDQYLKV